MSTIKTYFRIIKVETNVFYKYKKKKFGKGEKYGNAECHVSSYFGPSYFFFVSFSMAMLRASKYRKGPLFEAKIDACLEEILKKNKKKYTVAKEFNIPGETLMYRLQKKQAHEEVLKPYGNTKFTREQEDMLANHMLRMASIGYGLTRAKVS